MKSNVAAIACAAGVCAMALSGAPWPSPVPQAANAETITSDATMTLVQGTSRSVETMGAPGDLSWKTSKASVAVAKDNEIRARRPGNATVTLESDDTSIKLPVKVVRRYNNNIFGTGYQLSGKSLKSAKYKGGKLVVKGKVKNLSTGKSKSKTWTWKVASKVIDADEPSGSVLFFSTGDWMSSVYSTDSASSFGKKCVSRWKGKKSTCIWVKRGKVAAYSTGEKGPDGA